MDSFVNFTLLQMLLHRLKLLLDRRQSCECFIFNFNLFIDYFHKNYSYVELKACCVANYLHRKQFDHIVLFLFIFTGMNNETFVRGTLTFFSLPKIVFASCECKRKSKDYTHTFFCKYSPKVLKRDEIQ